MPPRRFGLDPEVMSVVRDIHRQNLSEVFNAKGFAETERLCHHWIIFSSFLPPTFNFQHTPQISSCDSPSPVQPPCSKLPSLIGTWSHHWPPTFAPIHPVLHPTLGKLFVKSKLDHPSFGTQCLLLNPSMDFKALQPLAPASPQLLRPPSPSHTGLLFVLEHVNSPLSSLTPPFSLPEHPPRLSGVSSIVTYSESFPDHLI